MKEKICYILAAGSYYNDTITPDEDSFVIAADAGLLEAKKKNITVSLAVGDMDSLDTEPDLPNTVLLPTVKNDTDTLAAIRIGLDRGCNVFHIFGATGGERIDHTLANLQCLVFLSKHNAKGFIYSEHQIITAVTDGKINFPAGKNGFISVFAADGTACGVYEKGLKYELDCADISGDFPIGVSNEFLPEKNASVSVEKGTLIVIYPK